VVRDDGAIDRAKKRAVSLSSASCTTSVPWRVDPPDATVPYTRFARSRFSAPFTATSVIARGTPGASSISASASLLPSNRPARWRSTQEPDNGRRIAGCATTAWCGSCRPRSRVPGRAAAAGRRGTSRASAARRALPASGFRSRDHPPTPAMVRPALARRASDCGGPGSRSAS